MKVRQSVFSSEVCTTSAVTSGCVRRAVMVLRQLYSEHLL